MFFKHLLLSYFFRNKKKTKCEQNIGVHTKAVEAAPKKLSCSYMSYNVIKLQTQLHASKFSNYS